MLIEAAILGLVIGYLFGGRLKNLATVEFKGLVPIVAAVVLQYGSQFASDFGLTVLRPYGPVIFLCSFVLILWVIWMNRRIPPLVLTGLGVFLNILVIAANGGKMPVSPEALHAGGLSHYLQPLQGQEVLTHQVLSDATRLRFLADIFALPKAYPRARVFSVGDVLLSLGVVWFLAAGMAARLTRRKKSRGAEVTRLTKPL